METILKHAQGLVYALLHLMPSPYQHASLSSLLGLFLEAQGHPLPQHCETKSASARASLSQSLRVVYPCGTANDSTTGVATDGTASTSLWQSTQGAD